MSTHVLDAADGTPAVGMAVTIAELDGTRVAAGITNDDGRIPEFADVRLQAGNYRIVFDTGGYFETMGRQGFYPEVTITFSVAASEHYHVPLLLSPYAYSTYRGS
ncbi:hydroxyisourate hydrolase [Actinobacteria bacterium YIM 96077]|uniref:5-hydroxyisourate hydrolase n=1 Tax=Phytoactinopolyspora halophila TaxID=1981511 RepID=A0A329R0M3_9ACTN|nr:hydroxyisourate hydrolase [Actinobacteria bacterium YIM 96077]RAW18174.1 hydroxyisourate hydrolase [Phytoactinopolyspora halophila]